MISREYCELSENVLKEMLDYVKMWAIDLYIGIDIALIIEKVLENFRMKIMNEFKLKSKLSN